MRDGALMVSIPVIEDARTEDYTVLSSHSRVDLAVKAAVRRAKETAGVVILHDRASYAYAERWYVAITRSSLLATS